VGHRRWHVASERLPRVLDQDAAVRECLALEGPPLLQMATERGMEAGPLQKLTNAVTEWTENAAKQAAADTEAAA
jgi:hypothetical protein